MLCSEHLTAKDAKDAKESAHRCGLTQTID